MLMMLRVFLEHLRTQAGRVCEIAEFGCLRRVDASLRLFARGTAQPCFRLAASMHNAEGSEALSKVAPMGACGLLPVRHEVTRRIKHYLRSQRFAISERLTAPKVAEGGNCRGVCVCVADHEQTSCGDPGRPCTKHCLHRHTVAVQCCLA